MEIIIEYPSKSDIRSTLKFCGDLNNLPNSEKILIDFKNMSRTEPFALIFASRAIRSFREKNPNTNFFGRNFSSKTYPANMGFFQSFGLNFGKKPGEAQGSKTYLPITILTTKSISDEAMVEWEPEQDVIERKAGDLAAILSRKSNLEVEKTLSYSITEIIRNIIEHSNSEDFIYSAQYWPSHDKVEISILDCGIGLKKSFESNPYVNPKNDKEAIQMAMLPGISSKYFKGVKFDRDDKWQNSGFGLYMLSRLCRNGGEMAIVSGDHCVIQTNDSGKEHFKLDYSFQGTAIKIVLEANKINDLSKLQLQFRLEGREIAKTLEGTDVLHGMTASQLITNDFMR